MEKRKRQVYNISDADIKKNVAGSGYNEVEKKALYDLATRLNKALVVKDESQEEFAKKIGVSEGALSNYRNGKRLPDTYVLVKIAAELKTTVDYLLGFTNLKSPSDDYRIVHQITGLSDKSIKNLKCYNDLIKADKMPQFLIEDAVKSHKAIDFLLQNDDTTGIFSYIASYLWDTYQANTELVKELKKFSNEDLENLIGDRIVLKTADNRNVSLKPQDMNKIYLISIEEILHDLKNNILNTDK